MGNACVLSVTGAACYGVFFNYDINSEFLPYSFGVDCTSADNFDPDIAGIGVRYNHGELRSMQADIETRSGGNFFLHIGYPYDSSTTRRHSPESLRRRSKLTDT
jgi:hypothetical protein